MSNSIMSDTGKQAMSDRALTRLMRDVLGAPPDPFCNYRKRLRAENAVLSLSELAARLERDLAESEPPPAWLRRPR